MASIPEQKPQEVLAKVRPSAKLAKTAASPVGSRFWFYFSYARMDLEPYLRKFYKDLEREIQNRLGIRENIGFFGCRLYRA